MADAFITGGPPGCSSCTKSKSFCLLVTCQIYSLQSDVDSDLKDTYLESVAVSHIKKYFGEKILLLWS